MEHKLFMLLEIARSGYVEKEFQYKHTSPRCNHSSTQTTFILLYTFVSTGIPAIFKLLASASKTDCKQ